MECRFSAMLVLWLEREFYRGMYGNAGEWSHRLPYLGDEMWDLKTLENFFHCGKMFETLFLAQVVLPNSTVPLQLKDVVGKGKESLRSVTTHARRRNSELERSSVLLYFKLLSPLRIIFGQ
ncbi:hypothetical protein AVEN_170828-1 [Araneus ventricosus]|uniref:Uncharacterized protein n=1 Tax=Araneus ventricosus TaxID=182803 RepID=A0A4Y2U7F5_ARAVE|nr:hypothetical protein AVEN_34731-1 [Araneus ventricosus]GBO07626.1 hypothetical protein AVEN_170828-1 [Araneus ventricosus]